MTKWNKSAIAVFLTFFILIVQIINVNAAPKVREKNDVRFETVSEIKEKIDKFTDLKIFPKNSVNLEQETEPTVEILQINTNEQYKVLGNQLSMTNMEKSDLIITSVKPLGELIHKSPAGFAVTIENRGAAKAGVLDLYTFVDNYKFSENRNLTQLASKLDPGTVVTIEFHISNTSRLKGETKFKFYLEDSNDIDNDNNWKYEDVIFSPSVDSAPALPVYYIVYQDEQAPEGDPGVIIHYSKKEDPDRKQFIMAVREKGDSEWIFYGLGNVSNEYHVSGIFEEGKIYQISAGVQSYGIENVYIQSTITEVMAAADPRNYTGAAEGYVTINNEKSPEFTVHGHKRHADMDESGKFYFENMPSGSNFAYADLNNAYEPLLTGFFVNISNTTENIRVFTRLKEDYEPPVINILKIKDKLTYKVANASTVTVMALGSDNIAVKEGDFHLFNPNSQNWELIGTFAANDNQIEQDWYISEEYLGAGYKLKAQFRDFRGNVSEEKTWGPFEIVEAAPDISVTIDKEVPNESFYYFGASKVNQVRIVAGSIVNNGTGPLELTGAPRIRVEGATEDISVAEMPGQFIEPGGFSLFKLKFEPKSPGEKIAKIYIESSDYNKTPYVIYAIGRGKRVNLIAEYHLDEDAGATSFADTGVNPNTGFCDGDYCPESGVIGKTNKAVQFDGNGDHIKVKSMSEITPTLISLEAWIKPEKNEAWASQVVITKQLAYEMTILNNGALRLGTINEFGERVVFNIGYPIKFNEWNHVVMTYDGAKIRGYVNGELKGEKEQTGSIFYQDPTRDLTIGGFRNGFTFKGEIDEVKIYDGPLSPEEIVGKYKSSFINPETVLVAYDLNEPAGSTRFVDTSGNEQTAVCYGEYCPESAVEDGARKSVKFDGAGDHLIVKNSDVINPREQISLEAWIKPEKNQAWASQVVMTKQLSYEMTLLNNGSLRAGITNEAGQRVVFNMGYHVKFNEWNHVVVTYDGSMIRGYVNGELKGEKPQSGLIQVLPARDLTIGGFRNAFSVKGEIDKAGIYNIALSGSDIKSLYLKQ